MGAGIAEVFARTGSPWSASNRDDHAGPRPAAHRGSTDRAVAGARCRRPNRRACWTRSASTDLDALAGQPLVIEAVPEQLDLKRDLFARLDKIVEPGGDPRHQHIVTVGHRDQRRNRGPPRVLGMHFFNPAPVMKLVEVVSSVVTSADVVDDGHRPRPRARQGPVAVGDRAGFIANGLLFGYLNQAAAMYEAQLRHPGGHRRRHAARLRLPMGPLALLDLIGVDTAYEILETMYKQARDRLHAPAPILKQMMTAGLRGRKSGRGFYTYEAPDSPVVVPDSADPRGGRCWRTGARSSDGGRRRLGDDGHRDRRGLRQGRLRGGARRPRRRERAARVWPASTGRWTRAVPARQARNVRREGPGSDHRVVVAGRPRRGRPRGRGSGRRNWTVKQGLSSSLDEVCKPGAILATTTSSLPVIECAAATSRPADVVGMHFFNPAPVMSLVEVVATVLTADDVVATVRDVCHRVGKHPVTAATAPGSSSTRCCSPTSTTR